MPTKRELREAIDNLKSCNEGLYSTVRKQDKTIEYLANKLSILGSYKQYIIPAERITLDVEKIQEADSVKSARKRLTPIKLAEVVDIK